ncbi:P-loop containing nucleoside triphosphate hydrolase protein [Staphylotrichum tortipilum]|uniref:P-loop containing nucleoside triphosphate hydrolase protein n=1 Tax=Staphylotrichum tortipilum TaxID=2831512 RepID=A0AAN6MJL0_9PEZI|nr:P-loop containing nucleoside triphosphate hydrolase protein [Staphylotrichum longicolle]
MNGINGANGLNGHSGTETGGKGSRTGPPAPPAAPVPGAMLRSGSDQDDSRILAAVDKLRVLGIGRMHNLPQIIVCGAQSAGKSSVLESIVQVPFPRGTGTVTRYVTKVTMEWAATPSVDVRIIPGQSRGPEDRVRSFHGRDGSPGCAASLSRFMMEAHVCIFPPGYETNEPMIADDVLVVTVHGPDTRPLQVLDLPGLISYDSKDQGNVKAIRELVTRYMAEPHSIILAVVTANNDLQNQEVLGLCDKYDKDGARTIRVITRPDMAEKQHRDKLLDVMLGRDPNFPHHHRWHVLRNRAQGEANSSQAARDLAESRLLSDPPWNELDPSRRGIAALVDHLRGMLFAVAKRELPVLCDKLRESRRALEERFAALGGRRPSPEHLAAAMKAALDRLRVASHDHARGIYESDVTHLSDDGPVNLRSRVVERAEVFRDTMAARGHAWTTHIRLAPPNPNGDLGSVHTEALPAAAAGMRVFATLDDEIEWVTKKLRLTRDDLLQTFHNPHRIGNLFWEMSAPWNAISKTHIDQVHDCCTQYFSSVAPLMFSNSGSDFGSARDVVAHRFVRLHVRPRLEDCREEALKELARLEQDRKAAPLVSDLRFLWDRRAHREEQAFVRANQASHALEGTQGSMLDKTAYAKSADMHTQDQWTFATADEFHHAMWSLYQIELDIYITNVRRQTVERHFLRKIREIIPDALEAQEIEALTREDSANEAKKKEVEQELAVLEKSLRVLEELM